MATVISEDNKTVLTTGDYTKTNAWQTLDPDLKKEVVGLAEIALKSMQEGVIQKRMKYSDSSINTENPIVLGAKDKMKIVEEKLKSHFLEPYKDDFDYEGLNINNSLKKTLDAEDGGKKGLRDAIMSFRFSYDAVVQAVSAGLKTEKQNAFVKS